MFDLDSLRQQLADKEAERQGYLDTAAAIGVIYDRLVEDKRAMKGYRKTVSDFIDEEYDSFKGDFHKNSYQASGANLLRSYDLVIGNIDTNMDRLNTAKCQWENKAAQCVPVIGHLQSLINSILTSLENQFN